MIQECQDGRGIEIGQLERRDRLLQPDREVGQQEAEGIAVSLDRAPARTLLFDQAAAEILDQDVEGRSHETPPSVEGAANRSNRCPASANGSGMPSRYQ